MVNRKLLVAVDDRPFLSRLLPVLKARGAIVSSVLSTGAAEAALKSTGFDFLLVDTQMPSAGGLNWLRSLQRADISVPTGLLLPFWDDPRKIEQQMPLVAFACHKILSPAEIATRIAKAGIAPSAAIPLRRVA